MSSGEMPRKLASELERIVLDRIANNRLILPAMPTVPQRCLEILREPDFNVRKLVKELEAEPVLALLVVRAANAATFGRGAAFPCMTASRKRLCMSSLSCSTNWSAAGAA